MIRRCGRTDLQEGDSATLYQSVHERSGDAVQLLESMGVMGIAFMDGGMTVWNDSSLPVAR